MQEEQLIAVAQIIEKAVDDELERMDQMDDDELKELRRKRIAKIQEMKTRREDWIRKGHGTYRELTDAKAFFEAAKSNERVVCHFFRSATERCSIVDRHLAEIAAKQWETLFIRIDVERVPQLAEKFNVIMLPSIMLIEKGYTFYTIIGFDEMGGRDDFPTSRLADLLSKYGMINLKGMFADDQHPSDDDDE